MPAYDAAEAIALAYNILCDLTTDEFSRGGDRPARALLAYALEELDQGVKPDETERELGWLVAEGKEIAENTYVN